MDDSQRPLPSEMGEKLGETLEQIRQIRFLLTAQNELLRSLMGRLDAHRENESHTICDVTYYGDFEEDPFVGEFEEVIGSEDGDRRSAIAPPEWFQQHFEI